MVRKKGKNKETNKQQQQQQQHQQQQQQTQKQKRLSELAARIVLQIHILLDSFLYKFWEFSVLFACLF